GRIMWKTSRGYTEGQHGADRTLLVGGVYGALTDQQKAADWYRKAAERGNPDAQFNLGVMYEQGRGVPQSAQQGYVWLSVALANGCSEQERAMKLRDALATQLSSRQLAEAQKLAATYFEQY